MSGIDSDMVTPELALVDPELAEAERQISDRKAAMSSSSPSNGTFFIDPAQPAPVGPEPSAAPAPMVEPVPVPAAVPAESVAPALAPAPAPAPSASVPAEDGSTPMRDVPLGTLIFRAGLLAEEQLEDALQEGMRTGKRLGEVLLERGWLHERDLGRLLAGQKGLPFVEIRASDAEPAALQTIPEEKARLQTTLPLRYEEGQLVVAVADPSNELVIENLRRSLGSEPRLVVAPQADLIRAIGEAYDLLAAQTVELPQEPTIQQPQPLQQEPTPTTQEPTIMQEPTLQPEPTLEPPQPAPAPAVAPLPTTLPPAEARDAQPADAPLLQPHVAEPVAEPVVESLTPPAPVAAEIPAPQPEPTVVPEAVTPAVASPVETQPASPEPLMPVAPLQPPVEPAEAQPAPEAPPEPLLAPPAAEHPVESSPVPLAEVVSPVQPEASVAAPAVSTESSPGVASIHIVLLRLRDGEALEVGTFQTAAEASARAQEVVQQISTAEGDASWPFFADRYLRPDTIVSVDLLEEQADKWMGSAARSRWGQQ